MTTPFEFVRLTLVELRTTRASDETGTPGPQTRMTGGRLLRLALINSARHSLDLPAC